MKITILIILLIIVGATANSQINSAKKTFRYLAEKKREKVNGNWTEWTASEAIIVSETVNWKQNSFTLYDGQNVESYSVTAEDPPFKYENKETALNFRCLDKNGNSCNITLFFYESANTDKLALNITYPKRIISYFISPLS